MAERVTVLELMGQASASTPATGAAAEQQSTVDSRQSAGSGPPPLSYAPPGEDLEARVERLQAELEEVADPRARAVAEELLSAVLELHGEGLERMLELVGEDAAQALADDPMVGGLLLIHGLYPVPLEERVLEALDGVRPYMESHGGNVEFLGIEEGVAKLRLEGSCRGCAASAATLELAIERALMEAAPDLLGMDVEGADEPATHGPPDIGGTPLPLASNGAATAASVPELAGWLEVDGVAGLHEGQLTTVTTDSVALIVANVNGTLLAYRDACASCGSALTGAALDGSVLACPSCSTRYDLPRAGKGVDDGGLQLAPVPLLRDGAERVRVALPA